MEVIRKRLTRGDGTTQPGGVIMRKRDDGEFVVHTFVRDYGTAEPREFFWGRYTRNYYQACEAFEEKVDRCRGYVTGGSLIPGLDEEAELRQERLAKRLGEFQRDGFVAVGNDEMADPGELHDLLGSILGGD